MKNIHSRTKVSSTKLVIDNPWRSLKKYTSARIGLGRVGSSVPTAHHLAFQLDHAMARDAVFRSVPWEMLHPQIGARGLEIIHLHSRAENRQVYLQRPDLGRRLTLESAQCLQQWRKQRRQDLAVCLVVVDGLSAPAIEHQAAPMLRHILAEFATLGLPCPVIFSVDQGRVAIGDEIAQLLNAELLVVLIGERPGLSSPDSLGIYFTYRAKVGIRDDQRNCLSNIRSPGLGFAQASQRLSWLINEARRLHASGVKLKDNSQQGENLSPQTKAKFRLG